MKEQTQSPEKNSQAVNNAGKPGLNNATRLTKEDNAKMNDDFEKLSQEPYEGAINPDRKEDETERANNNSGVSLFSENNEVEKTATPSLTMTVDISNGDLPDLDEAEVVALDMASNYWSPTQIGESKRVYFDKVEVQQVQSKQDEDVIIDLPCAFFFEKRNGEVKTHSNGSKRLVAIMERNHIERGTPILITYLGKKRNSTNSFLSDDWSVKPLILKIS